MGTITQKIFLGTGWYDAAQLDGMLSRSVGDGWDTGLAIHFAQETKLTVSACLRLLSFVQHFVERDVPIELHDLTTWGLGAYLDRIGLFEHVDPAVVVRGVVPSGQAQLRRGQNHGLEEIVAIPVHGEMDRGIPNRLTEKLAACAAPDVREALASAAFTYIAELVDNIRTHSRSPRPGYAALQVYTPLMGSRRLVELAVADAGQGVLATLRPALAGQGGALAKLDDQQLLLHAVNQGVSRHGNGAGCGITQSAKRVLLLPEPRLDLRLPGSRTRFASNGNGGYVITEFRAGPAVPPLPGTHWVARYALD